MAILGLGTDVRLTNISTVGEIREVRVSPQAGFAEFAQTTSKFLRVIPVGLDPGEAIINVYYDGGSNAEAEDFLDELKQMRSNTVTIDFPQGRFVCDGYVSGVAIGATVEGAMTLDISMRLDGEWEFG